MNKHGGLNIYIWRLGSSKSIFDMAWFGCNPLILTLHMTTFLMHICVEKEKNSCISFLEKGTNSIFHGVGAYPRSHL